MRFTVCILGMTCFFVACGPPTAQKREAISFQVLSHGESIDLGPHIVAGQVTVFEVFADWCAPCKVLDLSLQDLERTYGPRITVHKLDLVSFDSNLAKSMNIKDLPYMIVYNEQQQMLNSGPSNQVLPQLLRYLNQ